MSGNSVLFQNLQQQVRFFISFFGYIICSDLGGVANIPAENIKGNATKRSMTPAVLDLQYLMMQRSPFQDAGGQVLAGSDDAKTGIQRAVTSAKITVYTVESELEKERR